MGWIPRWGSLWMAFPSVSAPLFVPPFPFDRINSGLTFSRWVGGSRRDQEEHQQFSAVPLSGKRGSAKIRHTSITQLAVPASQALSLSLRGVLFIPSKHHMSSTGFSLADITLPVSPCPQKWQQQTAAHHQKFFGAFLSMASRQMQLNYTM